MLWPMKIATAVRRPPLGGRTRLVIIIIIIIIIIIRPIDGRTDGLVITVSHTAKLQVSMTKSNVIINSVDYAIERSRFATK